MNLICAVRSACFLALCSILPQSNAMRPNVIGYYGTYKEIDYYTLDALVTNSLVNFIYNGIPLPGDNNITLMRSFVKCDGQNIDEYINDEQFNSICNSLQEVCEKKELMTQSIVLMKKMYENETNRMKAAVHIFLNELLLQFKQL